MRTKEAIEAECRTAQRSVEKQLKLLEKAQEVEKGSNAQIVSLSTYKGDIADSNQSAHEKGLTALKNSALDLQNQLASVTSEKVQLELRLQQAQSSLSEV